MLLLLKKCQKLNTRQGVKKIKIFSKKVLTFGFLFGIITKLSQKGAR